MKFNASLSLILIAAATASTQSVSAQETRGARFNYAPNIYRAETSRLPKGYGEHVDTPHNVRSGAVPSNSMLGLEPGLLEKPPAPMPQVAAQPATTSVTPAIFVPKINANYSPAFGKPQSLVAQSLPAAMPVPAVARPMVAPAKPATAPVQIARRHPSGVHTALSGRIRPVKPIAPVAATPAVASYDKNFGYVPGAYLPTNSGGGNANATVSGKIMTKSTR